MMLTHNCPPPGTVEDLWQCETVVNVERQTAMRCELGRQHDGLHIGTYGARRLSFTDEDVRRRR